MAVSRTLSVPFSVSAGGIATTTDAVRQVTQRVYSVVATQPGERVMRSNYGTNLAKYTFGLAEDVERQELADEVRRALQVWEPDVQFLSVAIDDSELTEGTIHASINFAMPTVNGDTAVITQSVTLGVVGPDGSLQEAAPSVVRQSDSSAPPLPGPQSTNPVLLGAISG